MLESASLLELIIFCSHKNVLHSRLTFTFPPKIFPETESYCKSEM